MGGKLADWPCVCPLSAARVFLTPTSTRIRVRAGGRAGGVVVSALLGSIAPCHPTVEIIARLEVIVDGQGLNITVLGSIGKLNSALPARVRRADLDRARMG